MDGSGDGSEATQCAFFALERGGTIGLVAIVALVGGGLLWAAGFNELYADPETGFLTIKYEAQTNT